MNIIEPLELTNHVIDTQYEGAGYAIVAVDRLTDTVADVFYCKGLDQRFVDADISEVGLLLIDNSAGLKKIVKLYRTPHHKPAFGMLSGYTFTPLVVEEYEMISNQTIN